MLLARHNRKCVLGAMGWLLLSPFGWIAAWWFFRYVPAWSLAQFEVTLSTTTVVGIAVACMLALCASAWKVWKQQTSLLDDMVQWDHRGLTEETAGAIAVGYYASQVTAPALLVSRFFLLGPLSLLRAFQSWNRRLPSDAESERRIHGKWEELQKIGKWQGMSDHGGDEIQILQLAMMGLIDFSTKPTVRFKAKTL
jgi:hypothetical protein